LIAGKEERSWSELSELQLRLFQNPTHADTAAATLIFRFIALRLGDHKMLELWRKIAQILGATGRAEAKDRALDRATQRTINKIDELNG
jgi:hypothetical protein